jgi:hypothetical protein
MRGSWSQAHHAELHHLMNYIRQSDITYKLLIAAAGFDAL